MFVFESFVRKTEAMMSLGYIHTLRSGFVLECIDSLTFCDCPLVIVIVRSIVDFFRFKTTTQKKK